MKQIKIKIINIKDIDREEIMQTEVEVVEVVEVVEAVEAVEADRIIEI